MRMLPRVEVDDVSTNWASLASWRAQIARTMHFANVMAFESEEVTDENENQAMMMPVSRVSDCGMCDGVTNCCRA